MDTKHDLARALGVTLLLATGAAGAGGVGGTSAQPTMVQTELAVHVDAQGRVVGVDSDDALPELIRDKVTTAVRAWRFAPVSQDGRAVSGTTYATVNVCVLPRGDELAVGVDHVGNGPGRVKRNGSTPVPFPPASLATRGDSEYKMRLRYRVLPTGRAELEHAELVDPQLQRRHAKAIRDVASRWLAGERFKPEILDGAATSTTIEQPVTYSFQRAASAREVERLLRDSIVAKTLASDACRVAGGAPEERAVAIDSPFARLPES